MATLSPRWRQVALVALGAVVIFAAAGRARVWGASGAAPASACPSVERLRETLAGKDLSARIGALGLTVGDVEDDLAALPAGEQCRVAKMLDQRLSAEDSWDDQAKAMFVVLVALMHETRTAGNIVHLWSGSGAVPDRPQGGVTKDAPRPAK